MTPEQLAAHRDNFEAHHVKLYGTRALISKGMRQGDSYVDYALGQGWQGYQWALADVAAQQSAQQTPPENRGKIMNTSQALAALEKISRRCGKTDVCCGCPIPGQPGDGYLQPPDPPECCREYDNVDDLIAVVRAALAQPVEAVQPGALNHLLIGGCPACGKQDCIALSCSASSQTMRAVIAACTAAQPVEVQHMEKLASELLLKMDEYAYECWANGANLCALDYPSATAIRQLLDGLVEKTIHEAAHGIKPTGTEGHQ